LGESAGRAIVAALPAEILFEPSLWITVGVVNRLSGRFWGKRRCLMAVARPLRRVIATTPPMARPCRARPWSPSRAGLRAYGLPCPASSTAD